MDYVLVRQKDLPDQGPAVIPDSASIVIDSAATGTRKVTFAELKSTLADAFGGAEIPCVEAASDGATDALEAITAALTVSTLLRFRAGIYLLGDNLTIAAGKVVMLEPGAVFKPANGKKLTINGQLVAGRQVIGDWSAGGKIVFGSLGDTAEILAEWYGCKGDNSTNNDAAFARIFDQTLLSTENAQPVVLGIGYYNFVAGFTARNKTHIRGVKGKKTRMQFAPTITGAFITLPDNLDHITLEGVQLNCTNTTAGIRTTAIGHADAAHEVSRLQLRDCALSGFNQYGLNIGKAIYLELLGVEFSSISNLASQGGTGDGSAICVNVQTFANVVYISNECGVSSCEQFLKSVSSTSLTIEGECNFEQASTAVDAIANKSHFIDVQGGRNARVLNCYFEGIRADSGSAVVHFTNCKAAKAEGNFFAGVRAGIAGQVSDAYVWFNTGVTSGTGHGNTFEGTPTLYLRAAGSLTQGSIQAFDCVFADSSGTPFTSYAAIKSRISTGIINWSLAGAMLTCATRTHRIFNNVAGVAYPMILGKDRNGTAGAVGDGTGLQMNAVDANAVEQIAADLSAVYTNATGGVQASDFIVKLLRGGVSTEVWRLLANGGIQCPLSSANPAAPASGGVLYFDSSGGKTRLMVRFPTGAVQVLSTEP